MIDYQRLFHVGVCVADLEAAMDDLGTGTGVTWAEPRESDAMALWTPEHGLQELPLRFAYSAEGPQHIELLEGPPGSFWDGRQQPGAHHVGVWVDDLTAETSRLRDAGWTLVGANADPDEGGYGVFTYLRPPSGLIVELVDSATLPFFEQWWSSALG